MFIWLTENKLKSIWWIDFSNTSTLTNLQRQRENMSSPGFLVLLAEKLHEITIAQNVQNYINKQMLDDFFNDFSQRWVKSVPSAPESESVSLGSRAKWSWHLNISLSSMWTSSYTLWWTTSDWWRKTGVILTFLFSTPHRKLFAPCLEPQSYLMIAQDVLDRWGCVEDRPISCHNQHKAIESLQ